MRADQVLGVAAARDLALVAQRGLLGASRRLLLTEAEDDLVNDFVILVGAELRLGQLRLGGGDVVQRGVLCAAGGDGAMAHLARLAVHVAADARLVATRD